MDCIYCGQNTRVTNSRSTNKSQTVWRRRQCQSCSSVFTTHENPDLFANFMVQKPNSLQPFRRDTLYISIYDSCRHRSMALDDAQELTKTIITKLTADILNPDSVIALEDILSISVNTLAAFDTAAASYYQAYYVKGKL